ncbi:MAG: SpoIIE family protein phosphatase [Oscillospiraceae bacterium]|nr:SpoIIE family protein phosphatase [Oscillospiraceae bacterium]
MEDRKIEFAGEEQVKVPEFLKNALTQGVFFGIAALLASGKSEIISPLALSFCSGCKRKYLLFSVLGSIFGYLISSEYVNSFRFAMATFIVFILRAYLHTFPDKRNSIILPALISAFSVASTGAAVMIISPFNSKLLFSTIAGSIASFGGAYFFSLATHSFKKVQEKTRLLPKDLTALSISAVIIFSSLTRIQFFGISLGGIGGALCVIIFAYLFHESGGALTGIGGSVGAFFAGSSPLSFAFSIAGLFSGLFSYSGKFLCAMAYVFAYGASFVYLGGGTDRLGLLIESAVASVIFLIIPKKAMKNIKTALSLKSEDSEDIVIIKQRLRLIKEALAHTKSTVSKVSEMLSEKAPADTAGVYLRVRDSVCSGCGGYNTCWGRELSKTVEGFDEMLNTVRKSGSVTPSVSPPFISSKCIRIMSLCDSFNKSYSAFSARFAAEGRINEMRKITSDQYDSFCLMINDVLEGFGTDLHSVPTVSTKLACAVETLGINAVATYCENEAGKSLVNLELPTDTDISDKNISDCISSALEKDFPAPITIKGESQKMLFLWEKPQIDVKCDYYQISADSGDICGDCFDAFYDGKGGFAAILSDGMGTGSRAAVDSTLALSLLSRLILAGFSFSCAMRLVNSALLIKSHEESLATLDILKLDLYTGKAVIYKAGATVSLIKRKGKVSEIKRSAMPVGILREAQFGSLSGTLYKGDIVVLMSDGAADFALTEIKNELLKSNDTENLSQRLCTIAKSKMTEKSDDITVACIKII